MLILLLLPLIPTLFSAVNAAAYGDNCPSTTCGNIKISYPFYYIPTSSYIPTSLCGYLGLGLTCVNNNSADPTTILSLPYNPSYIVKNINYSSRTITLVDSDSEAKCPRVRQNLTIETYPLTNRNVNLDFYFNCSVANDSIPAIVCLPAVAENGVSRKSYVFVAGREPVEVDWKSVCDEIVVAPAMVDKSIEIGDLAEGYGDVMRLGFVMDWGMKGVDSYCVKCENSGGMCGYIRAEEAGIASEKEVCYCGGVAAVKCKSSK